MKRVGVVTSYGFDAATIAKAGDGGRLQVEAMSRLLFAPEASPVRWDALYSMQGEQSPEIRENFLEHVRVTYSSW